MDYKAIRSEKVKLLYYGTGDIFMEDEWDKTQSDMNHYFILAGSKLLDPFGIGDLLDPADKALELLGVVAQPCVTLMNEEVFYETGYSYAFDNWIQITPSISTDLITAHTGTCTLAEAIAIWLLKQLGDVMDNAEEVAEEYVSHCMGIEPILSAAMNMTESVYMSESFSIQYQ